MIARRHLSITIALSLALLALLWLLLAPRQLGGRAIFVIVNGNSMEPLYYRGDLVIARTADSYSVGDIVTYRHPQIGPVIHRIIGRDGERWIFKGDHNSFIDPYRPLSSELLGRSWLHIPALGGALIWLRTPPLLALGAVGIGVGVMRTTGTRRRRGRQSRGARPAQGDALARRAGALLIVAVLAVMLLALLAWALARPSVQEISENIGYQQSGVFRYSAAAPTGIYDAPGARTGEPIFRNLSTRLDLEFSYSLDSTPPAELGGTAQMSAQLSTVNGWKRTITLQPPQEFRGRSFTSRGALDLVALQALIARLEQQTDLHHQQYVLTIMPQLQVVGTLAGQALRTSYAPQLAFRVDDHQIELLPDGRDEQDPLRPMQQGALRISHTAPVDLSLLGLPLPIGYVRGGLLLALLLALIGVGLLGHPLLRALRDDEAARIRLKYGALIVEAGASERPMPAQIATLATIDDLARIAEKHGALILHQREGAQHCYLVHDAALTYCYAPAAAQPADDALAARLPEAAPTPTIIDLCERVGAPAAPPASWQAAFLEQLRGHGCVPEACQALGISVVTAYRERERVPAFARAWTEALAAARQQPHYQGRIA